MEHLERVEVLAGDSPRMGTRVLAAHTTHTHARTIPRLLAAEEQSHERQDPVYEESQG